MKATNQVACTLPKNKKGEITKYITLLQFLISRSLRLANSTSYKEKCTKNIMSMSTFYQSTVK